MPARVVLECGREARRMCLSLPSQRITVGEYYTAPA